MRAKELVVDNSKAASAVVDTTKMADPIGTTTAAEPADDTINRKAGPDDMKKVAEPVVDDWLDGLPNAARQVKPKKKGNKGKKGQGRRQAGETVPVGEAKGRADGEAASEGEQSDDDNDGFKGRERHAARRGGDNIVAGLYEHLESKGEPPEAKAAEAVDEWMDMDDPAPAPESKKKGKRGKRNRKGPKRREPEAAGDGEAKGRADGRVAGEGGQSDVEESDTEHGHRGFERLASQMGPPRFLSAIAEGRESETGPPAHARDPTGGEQVASAVASGLTSGAVSRAAMEDKVVPEDNKATAEEASDEVSTASLTSSCSWS
jgi:hypothetical protein